MNAGSNIILAEGHSRGFWRSWKAIVIGVASGVVILLALSVWLLSRPLPIPEGTLFYAVATPEDAAALPEAVRNALPEDWNAYLARRARWPFVFGIYREGESLFSFVISPRWHAPKTEKIHQTTRGLILFAADTDHSDDRGRSYLSFLTERLRTGSLTLGVRPFEALGYVNGEPRDWISLHVRDGMIRSDVALSAAPAEPLAEADLSLHLPPEGSDYLTRHFETLPYLPASDRLARLPAIIRTDLAFKETGVPSLTRLQFERALNETEAGILLGSYDFTIRRRIVLPDGTTSFERVEPVATSGTTLFGPRSDETGRHVDLSDNTFTLLHTTTAADLRYAKSCSEAAPWMRFSADTVSTIAQRFGLALDAANVRPMQIISQNGKLGACFE